MGARKETLIASCQRQLHGFINNNLHYKYNLHCQFKLTRDVLVIIGFERKYFNITTSDDMSCFSVKEKAGLKSRKTKGEE